MSVTCGPTVKLSGIGGQGWRQQGDGVKALNVCCSILFGLLFL